MNADECARARNGLGVYLLGAIEPGERARLERHLASCPSCRETLAALAGMPAMLRKVPADEAIGAWMDDSSDQPSRPPLETLLGQVARTRRGRRWAIGAAALAASLSFAVVLVFRPAAPTPPAPAAPRWTATATGTDPATGVAADIRYAAQPWGSELEARVAGIPVGTRCQLWVTGAGGQVIAAGGWTIAAGRQSGWYPASVPFPVGALRGFEITAGGRDQVTVAAR